MTTRIGRFVLLGVMLFGAAQARAGIFVDFETVTSTQLGASIPVQGFDFNFIGGGAWAIGPAPSPFGNDNGTATLLVNSSAPPVEMSKQGGGTFSLTNFDAAVGVLGGPSTLDILGTLVGGATIAYSVALTDAYANILLPAGFGGDLTLVRFSSTSSNGFSLDNLSDSPVGGVPVPSVAGLMLLGLLPLLSFAGRKSRKLGSE